MEQIVLDDATLAKLSALVRPVELLDGSGKVRGRFYPIPDPEEYGPLEPQISREEILRRKQNKGKTYTTAEVLAYLEKL